MKQLLSLFAGLMVGLFVLADDKQSDDVQMRLKGAWKAVSLELDGKKAPHDFTITFDGKKFTIQVEQRKGAGTYKIDASKKPAELDLTITEGDVPDSVKPAKCIFELTGDTLRIGLIDPTPDQRPKSFDQRQVGIMTLRRNK
ncbi:MAG: TIGR03067 domain-containing protein [Planctomycetes bacterium]|nr:TIGR03067 domain-containing protein [Planctomycetota bacterium]